MSELKHDERGGRAVAVKTQGNSDGKGRHGFMLDWYQSQPQGVVAKTRPQLLAELFTSMLVLSSTFKFRPVLGTPNYLYWINGEWSLSLIAPEEWTDERREAFAGTCSLQRDMTWTITPSEALTKESPVADAMGRFYDAFANTLDTERTLEDILPFYVGSMPYYQRLYASALSRSVRSSMTAAGDQTNTSAKDWQASLPLENNVLLEYRD